MGAGMMGTGSLDGVGTGGAGFLGGKGSLGAGQRPRPKECCVPSVGVPVKALKTSSRATQQSVKSFIVRVSSWKGMGVGCSLP